MRPSPAFRDEITRKIQEYGPLAYRQYNGVMNALVEWVDSETSDGTPLDARAAAAALAYAAAGLAVTCGKPEEIRAILLEIFGRAVEECIP